MYELYLVPLAFQGKKVFESYKPHLLSLYDIQADSLVTAIKYDALKYGRTASEGGYEFTIWVGEMENYEGMISIESTTNELMEIMFPKRGDSTEK